MAFRAPLLAIVALALLLLAPAAAGQQTDAEASADRVLRQTPLPDRDLFETAVRLGRVAPTDQRVVASSPLAASVGRIDRFWVMGRGDNRYRQAPAELRYVGESAYWYVEQGMAVDPSALRASAAAFDERIYPLVRRYFGTEWLPGVDGDPRLTILLADFPDVLAYHSATDEYPRSVQPRSNEREMLYLNVRALRPGSPVFFATLAHELEHLIHWRVNPDQETWVNEGSAELASSLAGYSPPGVREFERRPATSLLFWADDPARSAAHYQAAYLFMQYFLERFLEPEDLYALLATGGRGPELFERYLATRDGGTAFDEVFKDWSVANFLDRYFPAGGRFGYRGLDVQTQALASLSADGDTYRGEAQQYGTDFLEIVGAGDGIDVTFQGEAATPLVALPPPASGGGWWGNRGDNLDSRMTRAFDLRGVEAAQIRFRLWFDTERDYDYGYLLASADGGRTWSSVCLGASSPDDPTGNNFGCGFSGKSGGGTQAEWLDENVDLSGFVGQEVLLRFEYVTDQAYSARGVVVDDLQVPELGFSDDGETDQGWQSEGFVRSSNLVSQRYSVRLLTIRGDGVDVADVPLDEARSGSVRVNGLGAGVTRAVLAISGLARWTEEPAPYSVEVRRAD